MLQYLLLACALEANRVSLAPLKRPEPPPRPMADRGAVGFSRDCGSAL